MQEKIDLLEFIPAEIKSGILGNSYPLEFEAGDKEIMLYYFVNVSNHKYTNCGKRQFSAAIPGYINQNRRTFEVFGLLQAEMSKTHNRKITFANCETNIVRLVMEWFKEELLIDYKEWKWYIKLNINKPENGLLREELEDNLICHWIMNSPINYESKYNTAVSYIKNTNNEIAANDGTLILEFNSAIFAQLIQNILIKIQERILNYNKEEVIWYMKGIIAGEGSIEINYKFMKYNVHISACKKEERLLYQKCLNVLGIQLKVYENYKETIISKRINNFKLLELDLMSLNPTKYAKFLEMISLYGKPQKKLSVIPKLVPIPKLILIKSSHTSFGVL